MYSSLMFNKIYRKIKKYNTIVIARHVGADPDALASQIALRDSIKKTFPKKNVYAIGYPASKFKYLGNLDKFQESMYENSLLIVTDTPDKKRIDGADPDRFDYSIKIDHHPFIEKTCKLELIDDTASSASQLVIELIFKSGLKLDKDIAGKLYIGLVADTNRFLFSYTTDKTFSLVSKLVNKTNLNFGPLYDNLYMRPLKEARFQGYITEHMTITEHGLGYILLDEKTLTDFDVDAATAGNMVNNFNYIDEIVAWVVFSYDKSNDTIRGSIRSRGPIINEVASHFNGGGHIFASGVRLKTNEEVDALVQELDEVCDKYLDKKD